MPEPREEQRSPRPRRRRLVREEAVFDGPPRTPAWIVAHADDADAWVTRNELALAKAVLELEQRLGLIQSQEVQLSTVPTAELHNELIAREQREYAAPVAAGQEEAAGGERHADKAGIIQKSVRAPESPLPPQPRELLCMKCGVEHGVWSADSRLWNATVRRDGVDEFPFLCANCFMALAEARGVCSMFFVARVDAKVEAFKIVDGAGDPIAVELDFDRARKVAAEYPGAYTLPLHYAQPSVASPQAEDTWIHPNRMGGVECIYGTRIPVWRVREHAAAGASAADIAALYDGQVTAAQVEAALSLESALPEQQKDADGRRGSPESALNYLAACALDVCENEDEMEAIRSRRDRVLKALRAASEPQQQEPVAWAVESDVGGRRHLFPRAYADKRQATHKARQFMRDRNATVVPLYRAGTQGKQTGGEV